jgi:hypothetical protein
MNNQINPLICRKLLKVGRPMMSRGGEGERKREKGPQTPDASRFVCAHLICIETALISYMAGGAGWEGYIH